MKIDKKYLQIIRRRFLEMFIASTVLSLIVVALFISELVPATQFNMAFVCTITALLFLVINFRHLHRLYSLGIGLRKYYILNGTVFLIFTSISLAMCFFAPVEVYSLLFSYTKFARYALEKLSIGHSLIFFDILLAAVICIAPFCMPGHYKRRRLIILHQKKKKQASQKNDEKNNSTNK